MPTAQLQNKQKFTTPYRWFVVALGGAALTLSSLYLPRPPLDVRFLILAALTILVSSRASIRIPRVNANVTVSDTFIFLVLLLYGGFAGILVAAAEGLFSGLRISKTPLVVAFNSAMMACSTYLTVLIVGFFFGPFTELRILDLSHLAAALGRAPAEGIDGLLRVRHRSRSLQGPCTPTIPAEVVARNAME